MELGNDVAKVALEPTLADTSKDSAFSYRDREKRINSYLMLKSE